MGESAILGKMHLQQFKYHSVSPCANFLLLCNSVPYMHAITWYIFTGTNICATSLLARWVQSRKSVTDGRTFYQFLGYLA